MGKIMVGTINLRDVDKRIRKAYPLQKEKAQSSPKGKRGYDRKNKSWRKDASS